MTDKEKFRAEIERLRGSFKVLSVASPSRDTTLEYIAKAALCKQILSFIDSMQEEPTTSVWHDASEKPKEGSWICVSFATRDLSTFLYEEGKIHNNYVDIEMIGCKWAYPEDLLKL